MIRDGKKFLDNRYREEREEIDPGDVTPTKFNWGTVDITYRSRFSYRQKTVRGRSATTTTEYNKVPEGFLAFWDDDRKLAYHPDDRRLVSLEGDDPVTLAEGDEIVKVESVSFPQRPTVAGAVDTGVEATFYYWSDRSDQLQSVVVDVDMVEDNTDNPWRISGADVTDRKRQIEALVGQERDIVAERRGWRSPEVHLGKVARVEFPPGHRYTVDLRGLTDGEARAAVEKIENRLTRRSGYDDVEVTHEGRIPEE